MSRTDGYLKIKTKLDNSDIDKDVAELENKINKLEKANTENSAEQEILQREIDSYEKLSQKADSYRQKIKELNAEKQAMVSKNPAIAISGSPDLTNINSQIDIMTTKYQKAASELDKQAPKIDKTITKLEKLKSKQTENNTKISEFKAKIEQINLNKIQGGLNTVGKSLQNQIGKLGKMAMAVVGIRTAWGAVRSAISTVSQYNPQIAANIDYIKYALANTLLPIIQKLISFAATLLSYINAITTAWFGINMFSNSSAKNFQKMKNSASGTAKASKETQKALQGFDEMNVLQDNSSGGSGSAGSVAPDIDLSGMQAEIPSWLQWIIDNKDTVLGIIAGITAGLISMKVLGLNPILSLGIGITIAGIVKSVQAIVNFIKNPTWENFIEVLEGISIAIVGIGVMIGVLTGNWIPLVIGLIALIVTEIVKHWDQIKEVLRKSRFMDMGQCDKSCLEFYPTNYRIDNYNYWYFLNYN